MPDCEEEYNLLSEFFVGNGAPIFDGEDIMEQNDQRFFFGAAISVGRFDQPYQVERTCDTHHYCGSYFPIYPRGK